jgi:hypothetical protein
MNAAPRRFERLHIRMVQDLVELLADQLVDLADVIVDHRDGVAAHRHVLVEHLQRKLGEQFAGVLLLLVVVSHAAVVNNPVEQREGFGLRRRGRGLYI